MAWQKKLVYSLLAAGFAVGSLAGCGQSGSGSTETGGLDSGGGTRTELFVGLGEEPSDGFDPTISWGSHGGLIFQSSLVKYDLELNIIGDLSTEYTVSDDGRQYTFTLRDDAKFSDGEPLTAEDVVFTFEKAKTTNVATDYSNLDTIQAEGDYTVVFGLKEPQSIFPHLLINQGIVPAHLYDENTYSANPVGSGPFVLKGWDRGQQMVLERNEFYYGTKPFFEKLNFAFLDEDAAMAAAKTGTVDLIATSPALADQEIPGMALTSADTYDPRGLIFPNVPAGSVTRDDGIAVGNDVTSDVAIRKAVNLAVDRQAMIEGVLNGHGNAVYTESDGMAWANPDAAFQDNDLDAAIKVLEEAGWVDTDGDGIREKDGVKAEFTIVYSANDSTRQSLAMVTADMLKPAGISAKPEGHSSEERKQLMYSEPWVMGAGEMMSPMVMYKLYDTRFAGDGYNNTGYHSNSTVDDYFAQALASTDADEATELWQKSQWDGTTGTSMRGDSASIWLVNPTHLYYVNSDLDLGQQRKHGHGQAWQITYDIQDWKWN